MVKQRQTKKTVIRVSEEIKIVILSLIATSQNRIVAFQSASSSNAWSFQLFLASIYFRFLWFQYVTDCTLMRLSPSNDIY